MRCWDFFFKNNQHSSSLKILLLRFWWCHRCWLDGTFHYKPLKRPRFLRCWEFVFKNSRTPAASCRCDVNDVVVAGLMELFIISHSNGLGSWDVENLFSKIAGLQGPRNFAAVMLMMSSLLAWWNFSIIISHSNGLGSWDVENYFSKIAGLQQPRNFAAVM